MTLPQMMLGNQVFQTGDFISHCVQKSMQMIKDLNAKPKILENARRKHRGNSSGYRYMETIIFLEGIKNHRKKRQKMTNGIASNQTASAGQRVNNRGKRHPAEWEDTASCSSDGVNPEYGDNSTRQQKYRLPT